MSELTELAKRLRHEGGKMLEMPGLEEVGADLLAAAEVLERSEWKRIDEKTPREAWVWVGRWWDEKNFIQSNGMFAIDRLWHDWTHWMPLPAPPEVKP